MSDNEAAPAAEEPAAAAPASEAAAEEASAPTPPSTPGVVRRSANKASRSRKKLAKRERVKPAKGEEIPPTPVEKAKEIALMVLYQYVLPFVRRHLLAVSIVTCTTLIIGLHLIASETLKMKQADRPNKIPDFTDRVNFTIAIGEGEKERTGEIEIGLYGTICPLTVENFINLATHKEGYGYQHTDFFFLRPGAIIAGGDVVTNNGEGGRSALDNDKLAGENFVISHFPGCIASPELTESQHVSQFYITFAKIKEMDKKAVVFGRLTRGADFFFNLNRIKVNENFQPQERIWIKTTKHVKEADVNLDGSKENSSGTVVIDGPSPNSVNHKPPSIEEIMKEMNMGDLKMPQVDMDEIMKTVEKLQTKVEEDAKKEAVKAEEEIPKTEEAPKAEEEAPKAEEEALKAEEEAPEAPKAVEEAPEAPKAEEEAPKAEEEEVLKAEEEAPQAVEEAPEATKEVPKAEEEAPKAEEEVPKDKEEAPQAVEEAPEAEEEAPQAEEEAPKAVEEAAQAEEKAPEVKEEDSEAEEASVADEL